LVTVSNYKYLSEKDEFQQIIGFPSLSSRNFQQQKNPKQQKQFQSSLNKP
jgi:hypothetical protein